jgi:hypothetical protein
MRSTIEKLLAKEPKTKQSFLGVFSSDNRPSPENLPKRRPIFYIVNSDIATGKGIHWMLIYYPQRGTRPEFFDSLGKSPSSYGIRGKYNYRNKKLQAHDSKVCGHYAVLYALERLKGRTPTQIYRRFGLRLDHNDNYVRKYIYKLINN